MVVNGATSKERATKGQDSICMFCNHGDMGKHRASCYAHEKECIVPSVGLLFVCAPERDADRKDAGAARSVLRRFFKYLDTHSVQIVIYVNSQSGREAAGRIRDDTTTTNMFCAEMSSRDFEGQRLILDDICFGLPHMRKKVYAVFAKTPGGQRPDNGIAKLDFRNRSMTDFFTSVKRLVQMCQRIPPDLDESLLPSDDQAIEQELLHCIRAGFHHDDGAWLPGVHKLYTTLRVPFGVASPFDSTKTSAWLPVLSTAQRAILIYHQRRISAPSLTASGQTKGKKPLVARDFVKKAIVDLSSTSGSLMSSVQQTFINGSTREIAPMLWPKQRWWLHARSNVSIS